MSKDFESKIKTQKEAKKVQEAPSVSGLKGRMALGFESEIKKAKEAKKMQQNSIKPLITRVSYSDV